jgi:hypothetical protein
VSLDKERPWPDNGSKHHTAGKKYLYLYGSCGLSCNAQTAAVLEYESQFSDNSYFELAQRLNS